MEKLPRQLRQEQGQAEFGVLALRQAWGLRFELADFQQRQKAGQQGATAPMPGYARLKVCVGRPGHQNSACPRRRGQKVTGGIRPPSFRVFRAFRGKSEESRIRGIQNPEEMAGCSLFEPLRTLREKMPYGLFCAKEG